MLIANGRIASMLGCLGLMGCTSFVDVRSADVVPGLQLDAGVTLATPPGDGPARFWSFDCVAECDHWIWSPHASLRFGRVPAGAGRPYELGAGFSGTYPYVTGYLQLARTRPFGVGARVGFPFGSPWREDALFARYDLSSGSARVVMVPTLFLHSGPSPNGTITGSLLGFAPALGIQVSGAEGDSFIASLTPVIGRYSHKHDLGPLLESGTSFFLVAGLAVSFHDPR